MDRTSTSAEATDRRTRAFTLVELMAVIVVLAVLAGVAMSKYFDYRRTAARSAEDAIVGAIRTGIQGDHLYGAGGGLDPQWLAVLDSAGLGVSASGTSPFFGNVLDTPVTDQWSTHATWCYTYIGPTGRRYTYDPATGLFRLRVDFTGDNVVGVPDLGNLIGHYGCAVGSGDADCDAADLDADGNVDANDVPYLSRQFGLSYPACP